MSREPVTLKPEDDLSVAESIMQLGRTRHLPVVSDGTLVGLITDRDVLRGAAARDQRRRPQLLVHDVMSSAFAVVTPQTTLKTALLRMVHNRAGCLLVVDADGRLVGLITEFDLVKFAAQFLEELDEVENGVRGI